MYILLIKLILFIDKLLYHNYVSQLCSVDIDIIIVVNAD